MKLSADDVKLIEAAKKLVKPAKVPGGIVGEVGAVLRTEDGNIYNGVCMHLVCGLGFCAEHTAIAAAITRQGPVEIDTILAANSFGIIPPCGRCRELMNDISPNGSQTWVIVDENEKIQLSELLPRAWDSSQSMAT